MSYLVCDKCGGYYELQPEESPDQFDICQCGGQLRYVHNFNPKGDAKSNTSSNIIVCPVCNGKNIKTAQICMICGKKLDKLPYSMKTTNNSKYKELINWKSIAIGCIGFTIIFMGSSFFIGIINVLFSLDYTYIQILNGYSGFLAIIIGGFVAAYATGPKYKSGIVNGALSILIIDILLSIYAVIGLGDYITWFNIGMSILSIFEDIILGIIGAFIGTSAKVLRINAKKDNKMGFLICDSCNSYYELQGGESSENFVDTCECGGKIRYTKKY